MLIFYYLHIQIHILIYYLHLYTIYDYTIAVLLFRIEIVTSLVPKPCMPHGGMSERLCLQRNTAVLNIFNILNSKQFPQANLWEFMWCFHPNGKACCISLRFNTLEM